MSARAEELDLLSVPDNDRLEGKGVGKTYVFVADPYELADVAFGRLPLCPFEPELSAARASFRLTEDPFEKEAVRSAADDDVEAEAPGGSDPSAARAGSDCVESTD